MKKLIAIIATLIIASVAVAETKFKYSIKGNLVTTSGTQVNKEGTEKINQSFTDLRLRPKFTLGDGTTKVVLYLEIDQAFGKNTNLHESDTQPFADLGADESGVIEVKQGYVQTSVAEAQGVKGLTLKGGVAGFAFPMFADTDAPLFNINYKFEDKFELNLTFVKTEESDVISAKDDAQIFGLDFIVTPQKGIYIHPGVFYYSVGESVHKEGKKFTDSGAIIFGLAGGYAEGPLSVDLAFVYSTGGKDKSTKVEYSGMGFDLAVNYKVTADFTAGVFFQYLSGNEENKDTEDKSYANSIDVKDGVIDRMFILGDAGSFGNISDITGGDITGKDKGLMLFGVTANFSKSGFSALVNIAYGMTAVEDKSTTGTGDKTDLGIEFDINLSYKVSPATKVFVEFAYLATGDAFGENGSLQDESSYGGKTESAMYIAAGLGFKL